MTFDEFLVRRAGDRRLARLTHDIVMPKSRGLEFGAAANPTLLPDGASVAYVDHANDAHASLCGAVSVDHVWSGSGAFPMREGDGAYDFAIAAQVAQYVPNLIGWFQGVFSVLRPGGVLNLSLPDRRFMFDVRRSPSTVGQLLDAFDGDFDIPSPGQVFDHTHEAADVAPDVLWTGRVDIGGLAPYCGEHALSLAFAEAERARAGIYVPCHCWVFTPFSFLDMLAALSRLRLFSFVISEFASTDPGDCEFFVCLRRDKEEEPQHLLAMQLTAIAHVRTFAEKRKALARNLART